MDWRKDDCLCFYSFPIIDGTLQQDVVISGIKTKTEHDKEYSSVDEFPKMKPAEQRFIGGENLGSLSWKISGDSIFT